VAGNQESYDRFSGAVDGPMTILTLVWLPVLVVPFVAHLKPALADACNAIDYTVWALFVVEYLIKLGLAPSRWGFVKTHVLDLIVISVPFLRPIRALRILRLLRAATVAGEGLTRAKRLLTQHGLHYVLLAAIILVFAGAAAELNFERKAPHANIHGYGDALWWAITTVTTVGYGDRFPVTAGGRGVAVVLMLVGIGLIGVITANVASYFVTKENSGERDQLDALESRLTRIESLLEAIAERTGVATASSELLTFNGAEPDDGRASIASRAVEDGYRRIS
jgi:voltage-gated potassium channel